MQVYKFGGSSIADANGIVSCARLALAHNSTGLIVLSAMADTTNLLEKASQSPSLFKQVREKHDHIIEELGLAEDLTADIYQEAESLEPGQKAQWCALGEALCCKIFAAHLATLTDRPISTVDARRLITTEGATPILEHIASNCKRELLPLLKRGHLVITQGFVGSSPTGETTLLGREGSDYSATLMAEAIKAKEVTIWSDVPGIFSADPNIVPDARPIPRLSYAAASALAECGAKVLFPRTLYPAERADIPVLVRSRFETTRDGTRISRETLREQGLLALVLSDGRLSLVGTELNAIPVERPEIHRGKYHRTFAIQGDRRTCEELLRQWHEHFFHIKSPSPALFRNVR